MTGSSLFVVKAFKRCCVVCTVYTSKSLEDTENARQPFSQMCIILVKNNVNVRLTEAKAVCLFRLKFKREFLKAIF